MPSSLRSEKQFAGSPVKTAVQKTTVTSAVGTPTYSTTSPAVSEAGKTIGPQRDPLFHPRLDLLRKAIPRHCFRVDSERGFYYLVKDYCLIAGVFFSSPLFEYFGLLGLILWYCVLTIAFFSLFSISHDGWHRSLATNPFLNDLLGHFASAPMMMPFYPFRMSHQKHHAHTNHVGKDAHHTWYTEHLVAETHWLKVAVKNNPLTQPLIMHVFYLIFGFPDGSHYWPFGDMYNTPLERIQCAISSASCIGFATAILWCFDWELWPWTKYYIIPVLCLGLMINIVTYLQHYDYKTEVYGEEEWHHIRAQLQTVDRTYGFGIEYVGHNMTNGHVVHHLFNRIPHYNLWEATKALKKALEPFKGTTYEYKHKTTYDFLPRHFVYQYYLDYLVERSKGIFHFRVRRDDEQTVG